MLKGDDRPLKAIESKGNESCICGSRKRRLGSKPSTSYPSADPSGNKQLGHSRKCPFFTTRSLTPPHCVKPPSPGDQMWVLLDTSTSPANPNHLSNLFTSLHLHHHNSIPSHWHLSLDDCNGLPPTSTHITSFKTLVWSCCFSA